MPSLYREMEWVYGLKLPHFFKRKEWIFLFFIEAPAEQTTTKVNVPIVKLSIN
jgi:hypothetical protein